MPPALDHVTITASDFAAGLAFYEVTLGALGLVRLGELGDEEEDAAEIEAAGWGPPGGPAVLWLVTGAVPTLGLHVRIKAEARLQVETFHAAAVAAGGSSHSAPRRWTVYRRGEFNAIVRDPVGNLIEAVVAE